MKKFIFIIVLVSLLVLSACGNSRDLSTPSSRLVGHWKTINVVAMSEYYFGEINEETGKGTFAEYDIRKGSLAKGTYKIVNETPEGEAITIVTTLFGYEDSDVPFDIMNPQTDLEVQKDGLKAKMRKYYIEYIDDKTEYDLSDHEPTQIPTQTPTIDPNITVYHPVMDGVALYETKTRETLLYLLDKDDQLIPADGATAIHCESLMCHVYSPRLEVSGWVMITNLDKDD